MPETAEKQNELQKTLADNWWLALLSGLVAIVLGAILLFQPELTLFLLVRILGTYLLIIGIFTAIAALLNRIEGWGWTLLKGILGILAGLFVWSNVLTSAVLTAFFLVYFLAVAALIMGVMDLVNGLRHRNRRALLVGSILSIIFGVLLLVVPVFSLKLLILLLGLTGIIGGILLVIVAFRVRNQETEA